MNISSAIVKLLDCRGFVGFKDLKENTYKWLLGSDL